MNDSLPGAEGLATRPWRWTDWRALRLLVRSGRESGDRDQALGVERVLTIARLVASALLLGAVLVDPHDLRAATSIALAVGFILYSLLLASAIRRRLSVLVEHAVVVQALDLVWTVVLIRFTGGSDSPYHLLFVHAILGAAYRWGLWVPLSAAGLAVLFGVEAVHIRESALTESTHLHAVAVLVGQVALGTGLIGLLADQGRRRRERQRTLHRILTHVGAQGGLVEAVRTAFQELFDTFGGRHGVLAFIDPDADSVLLWTAEPDGAGTEVHFSRTTRAACHAYLFEIPAAARAARIRRGPAPGAPAVTAVDGDGNTGALEEAAARAFDSIPGSWRTMLFARHAIGDWTGRVLILDPRPGTDTQLRFLLSVVGQLAPVLSATYLRRRLESRVGVVDRMRLGHQLHDGLIQSLVGIEMELQVLQHHATTGREGCAERLAHLQAILQQEILNVRDLMQSLRPDRAEAAEFEEQVGEAVATFSRRTGIRARIEFDTDGTDPPRRIRREISGIVQEALSNVRRHSGATDVQVRVLGRGPDWRLVVDDNGRGFGFEGEYDLEGLDRRGWGPSVIKERVRAFGGRLVILSRTDQGSRLDIDFPGGSA